MNLYTALLNEPSLISQTFWNPSSKSYTAFRRYCNICYNTSKPYTANSRLNPIYCMPVNAVYKIKRSMKNYQPLGRNAYFYKAAASEYLNALNLAICVAIVKPHDKNNRPKESVDISFKKSSEVPLATIARLAITARVMF